MPVEISVEILPKISFMYVLVLVNEKIIPIKRSLDKFELPSKFSEKAIHKTIEIKICTSKREIKKQRD